ncbi:hypothetical protein P4637_12495, partial [Halalkalibacterium halodurans]|uniref:hypothetical protein n=1 Tax=Halalkalibacterium halodurans TaxID=86665 RepID=UPI002E22B1B3|nr:hypothetical protein [Halalkalibacterium halodurans]MED4148199.1 hypothetical protein [Halalkalibacterium halodurans]MED4190025.1 hypothetical protein [Halalkalibacterium halodurans]MED4193230.1 hypothetical protein [Halalkalibacterium halodurans]
WCERSGVRHPLLLDYEKRALKSVDPKEQSHRRKADGHIMKRRQRKAFGEGLAGRFSRGS